MGPNAVGKTNILEAAYLLATGKSFRAEKEIEAIKEGETVGRVVGTTVGDELEVDFDARLRFSKTYKVNGVGKRQADFVGNLFAVLFSPLDLEIIVNGPAVRRRYLDSVLSQVHKDYRIASQVYEKALRQRNRLLYQIRELGIWNQESRKRLEYWNELLITNGKIIHERRKEYLEFLNNLPTRILPISLKYDHSIISSERLEKYAREELAAAATLVGPHRDDFTIGDRGRNQESRELKSFGSRGEQRLAVFAIKLGELEYVREATGQNPVLFLDDIFSELDHTNRHHILEVIPKQQTIMTTTDLHLVEKEYVKHVELIELQ